MNIRLISQHAFIIWRRVRGCPSGRHCCPWWLIFYILPCWAISLCVGIVIWWWTKCCGCRSGFVRVLQSGKGMWPPHQDAVGINSWLNHGCVNWWRNRRCGIKCLTVCVLVSVSFATIWLAACNSVSQLQSNTHWKWWWKQFQLSQLGWLKSWNEVT